MHHGFWGARVGRHIDRGCCENSDQCSGERADIFLDLHLDGLLALLARWRDTVFSGADSFNGDISAWDVSSARNLQASELYVCMMLCDDSGTLELVGVWEKWEKRELPPPLNVPANNCLFCCTYAES